jgi:phage protein D
MSDLNTLPVTPTARNPRGAVKLNGKKIDGWKALEVDNNAFRAADTFRATFALGGLPSGYGADWFAAQTTIEVKIYATDMPGDAAAYVPPDSDLLVVGNADDINFDPVAGTIELTGRDKTALLIDTKASENFTEKRSSDVATLIAKRRGLTPVVTATTTKIGNFYAHDQAHLKQEQSEWELLTWLASIEDFDVFVQNSELHFQPKVKDTGGHYAIQWRNPTADIPVAASNVISLQLSRSLTIAKGVSVVVNSWNAKQKKGFKATYPKSPKPPKPGASGAAAPQIYSYIIAGLTQDQATQRAKSIYDQIVQHMVDLTAYLPGDSLLDCSKLLELRGTGTGWDQIYYPDSVKRSISIDEGYRMEVTAKNIGSDVAAQQ